MDYFHYQNAQLHCEEVPVRELAERFGTPLWVYSKRTILHHYNQLVKAFAELKPLICYSVKANSNLGVLRVMVEAGSGFDVVSVGELYRVIKAGGDPGKVVFAGVGKTDEEIRYAVEQGVMLFDVESEAELERISVIAREMGRQVPVALRANPDVDPKTHRHIATGKKESKFGLDLERAGHIAREARNMPGVRMIGLHMHIGSQITQTESHAEAAAKGVRFIAELKQMGHPIEWFNFGGGFGIHYRRQEAKPADEFARVIVPEVKKTGCRLALEPGRFIVGNAGILVSRVLYTKASGDRRFLIQDAAMNDLIRPTLYDAFHRIWPVEPKGFPTPPEDYEASIPGTEPWDVVGPVCESGDYLAKDRHLPAMNRDDLLATFSAGAYGMVMSSNYNTRPRAAEVLVDGGSFKLIRRRETLDDLLAPELEV
ncbi:MAG: diaminopimelate decarboxylase [Planctomycetes bacterium]|nr:diaminopimelate decarboxylase [Planctomycetota bacterium]